MPLDPRNHSYGQAPQTPDPDEFSFVNDYLQGDDDEDDADSLYTLGEPHHQFPNSENGHIDDVTYTLPTHISSHGGMGSPYSPRTQPASPVGTPFAERPNHPLRALTTTNLVLNQSNGTDESLLSSSPLVSSQLRQSLVINENQEVPINGSDNNESWDDRGAAMFVKKVENGQGDSEDVVIKRSVKDFKFGGTLGVGSYSTVLLATDKNTQRQFAVKVLDKRHIIREKKVKYVNIEKNTLNRLGKHDGIVHLFFTFQDESSLYFVLNYAPNGELLSLIKEHGTLNEETTKYYASQILDAIKYIHDNGVVHRDLKPENILLDTNMRIQVTDFGTAKLLDKSANGQYPSDTKSKSFVGTAEYVSPELLNEKAVGKACDIWAFGCIVYQMIAGKPPFKATNEYLTFQKIVKLQYAFTAGFPMVVRDLIKKILVLNPKDRINIKGIQNHLFFSGIDFSNPKESIWNASPPEAGPYKISAKSMLPVPELNFGNTRAKITLPRRAVSASSTPTHPSSESLSIDISDVSSPSQAKTPTESQQVVMKAKAAVAARKQAQAQSQRSVSNYAAGAAGAAALALSRQPNDIIKAYNESKEKKEDDPTPPVSASSNLEKRTVPRPQIAPTMRKAAPYTNTKKQTVLPPMTKLDLKYIDYLKDSEERVLKTGDIVVCMTTVDSVEKKYKRRLVDSPLGGNRSVSSSMLSQVANGSYKGLRNMDKQGADAERGIITNHKVDDDSRNDSTRSRLKKFFSTASPEDDRKRRFLVVTSNARVLIFNSMEQSEDDEPVPSLELRTEINLTHPVIKIKELLPSSTASDAPSFFLIESYNTAFVFEAQQSDVTSWTLALYKARMAVFEKSTRQKLEKDPSGDAGTVLGSVAAESAARIAATSPMLKPTEKLASPAVVKPSASRSTSGQPQGIKHDMLKDIVSRKSMHGRAPKEALDSGQLYHGLPKVLVNPSTETRDTVIAAAEASRHTSGSSNSTSSTQGHSSNKSHHIITGMNSRLLARSSRKKR
jgi:serine/threonine protein kinase